MLPSVALQSSYHQEMLQGGPDRGDFVALNTAQREYLNSKGVARKARAGKAGNCHLLAVGCGALWGAATGQARKFPSRRVHLLPASNAHAACYI